MLTRLVLILAVEIVASGGSGGWMEPDSGVLLGWMRVGVGEVEVEGGRTRGLSVEDKRINKNKYR